MLVFCVSINTCLYIKGNDHFYFYKKYIVYPEYYQKKICLISILITLTLYVLLLREVRYKFIKYLSDECHTHYSNYQFYKVVDAVMKVLHLGNLFLETIKPWELKKMKRQEELDAVIHITMEALRICSIILHPIIPSLSNKLLDKLGVPEDRRLWRHCQGAWRNGAMETRKIQSGKFVLFPRTYVDKKDAKKKKAKS